METRARLMFHRAGLPEPELNALVTFDGGGRMLEGGFVWRRARVLDEYQGAQHATIRQRGVDHSRRLLAEDDGWIFLEVLPTTCSPAAVGSALSSASRRLLAWRPTSFTSGEAGRVVTTHRVRGWDTECRDQATRGRRSMG